MICKYLGWLINQNYYWCNKKQNMRIPPQGCKDCPYKEDKEEYDLLKEIFL